MDYTTPSLYVRNDGFLAIVRLRGPSLTDAHELAHITTEVETVLSTHPKRVILDLKHIEFAGSAALGMLIRLQRRANVTNVQLVLSHPQQIGDLLRVSQTEALFTLAEDLSAARKMI